MALIKFSLTLDQEINHEHAYDTETLEILLYID